MFFTLSCSLRHSVPVFIARQLFCQRFIVLFVFHDVRTFSYCFVPHGLTWRFLRFLALLSVFRVFSSIVRFIALVIAVRFIALAIVVRFIAPVIAARFIAPVTVVTLYRVYRCCTLYSLLYCCQEHLLFLLFNFTLPRAFCATLAYLSFVFDIFSMDLRLLLLFTFPEPSCFAS